MFYRNRATYLLNKTIDFSFRPFSIQWPFTSSLILLVIICKWSLDGSVNIWFSLLEIYSISFFTSLFTQKIRTYINLVFIVLISLLTFIETFIFNHFKLTFGNTATRLLFETNKNETLDFFDSFVFQPSSLIYLFWSFVLVLYYISADKIVKLFQQRVTKKQTYLAKVFVLFCVVIANFKVSWLPSQANYIYTLTSSTIEDFELRFIQVSRNNGINTALSRLLTALRVQHLSSLHCKSLSKKWANTNIDKCTFTSNNIFLFIGESYIKQHAQIYGYPKATTPSLLKELKSGNLFVFSDVITSFPSTSKVLKDLLSLHSIDQPGTWDEKPLFPQLFRLAGYHVSFLSNQFASNDDNIWTNSSGFFLYDTDISKLLFNYRNNKTYNYDDQLITELNHINISATQNNLIIFHTRGQHVKFEKGYPKEQTFFTTKDYPERKELNEKQKQTVAHYDNCTRYQDLVTEHLFEKYKDEDIIIIFLSDHGENVFDDGKTLGRVYNDFSLPYLKSEYQVPMWIWCSDKYKIRHPQILENIQIALNKPFQTDDLAHLLLELAGIKSKHFIPNRSIINKQYRCKQRIIGINGNIADYDKIISAKH